MVLFILLAAVGLLPQGDRSQSCAMLPADRQWIERALDNWRVAERRALRLSPSEVPTIVAVDATCTWTGRPGAGGRVDWTGVAHGGKVTFPDGNSAPVGPLSFAAPDTSGKGTGFFAMSLPSVWQAAGVKSGLGLERLMDAVLLHEMAHTRQFYFVNPEMERLGALYSLSDDITDDVVQQTFGSRSGYAAWYEKERDLLFAAAAAPTTADARRLAGEALAALRARRANWFTGADAKWVPLDDLFLTMEGLAQWTAYAWLTDPEGAGLSPDVVLPNMRRGGRQWSQDEGLALFLTIDRLVPGWQTLVFGPTPPLAEALLEVAARARPGALSLPDADVRARRMAALHGCPDFPGTAGREIISGMTVLVTGSGGHLGEALMRALPETGRRAVGADLKPSPFTTFVGSIADRAFTRRCLQGVDAVIHAATLHKPHVATHEAQAFIDTNVTGTLNLLEEAVAAGVRLFVFTSTTSTFGRALTPQTGRPAAWITEDVAPVPKNIYGVTKVAAESLCELVHRDSGLPCVVLRTSRFFPEPDDDAEVRKRFDDTNAKVNELLYRRVDVADVVSAHVLALEKAPAIGFGRYIISATTPFSVGDLGELRADAPAAVRRRVPDYEAIYASRGWSMFPSIDRVYVNDLARAELGWRPAYDFARALASLRRGEDHRSPLARQVGSKGYHAEVFADGPYPVRD